MREFFSAHNGNSARFMMFSPLHFGVLLGVCVILFAIFVFRKTLRQYIDIYRYCIAILAIVIECSYLVWLVKAGKWNFRTSLPLELCEITLILCILMLIAKSARTRDKIFETAYFWGLIGSTLALLFPNLHISYRHFPFWVFMLTHAINLISLAFVIFVEKYRPTYKSIRMAFIITNFYMVCIASLNHCLGSNYYFYYLFSRPAPNIPNPLQFTDTWFIKIGIIEGITLTALLTCYLPFSIANHFMKKHTESL